MALTPDTAPADLHRRPDLTRLGMRYRDEPATDHDHDRDDVLPARSVIDIASGRWPAARPEDCDSTGLFRPILDPGRLHAPLPVCPGRGLDGT